LLKAHWSGEQLDIDGKYAHAHGFAGRPLPVQQPHPPIFVGGGAPKVLRLAGAIADIVSINYNNASGRLGSASVASSTQDATVQKIGWIREGAGDRFREIELEIAAYFGAVSGDARDAAEAMAKRFAVSPEGLLHHPHALIGSLNELCEKLRQRREQF